MSTNVVSIFKYMKTDMGQCPECRGYIVQPNIEWLLVERFPDDSELAERVAAHEDTNWHCLECDYRW